MKKFGFIYALSFIAYPLLLFSSASIGYVIVNYETAGPLTILAFIYQLTYMIFLRKKENVSLKRSIALFFLYFFLGISVYIIGCYIYFYFAGYKVYAFFPWSSPPDVYYGFEAWEKFNGSYLKPYRIVIFTAVCALAYLIKMRKKQKGGEGK